MRSKGITRDGWIEYQLQWQQQSTKWKQHQQMWQRPSKSSRWLRKRWQRPRNKWEQLLPQPQQQQERAHQRVRKQCFEDFKSDKFDQTTRILADYVGKKYGGSARHVVKNNRNKIFNYPADINKTTATKTNT